MLAGLKAEAKRLGVGLRDETGDGFKGEVESIVVKWFLGQKKAVYRMSLVLSEADHVARFREVVKESSSGILPPTLTVETTTTSGWKRSGIETQKAPGAGEEPSRLRRYARGWRRRLWRPAGNSNSKAAGCR